MCLQTQPHASYPQQHGGYLPAYAPMTVANSYGAQPVAGSYTVRSSCVCRARAADDGRRAAALRADVREQRADGRLHEHGQQDHCR